MIEDLTVSTSDDVLADTTETSSGPLDALTEYFKNQAEESDDQVDNSDSDGGNEAVESAEADEPGESEGETADDTAEEPAADTKPTPKAAEDTTEADFDALTGAKDGEFITDPEALKAKFPRNSSKELLAETARYGEAAKRGQEVIKAIGGEAFVPGITTMAKALQEGNPRDVFTGIMQTAGAEELIKVIGDAVYVGLVQADDFAKNPESQAFGQALTSIINAALQEKFGPEMDMDTMGKLALWHQAGWFEKIDKWVKEEYIPHDELNELLEVTNDPKLLEAQQKIKELETQLGDKATKAEKTAAAGQVEVENKFGKMATEEIGKTLSNIVWKTSTLRDISTDTPETKQEKAFLRDQLREDAVSVFMASDKYAKLVEGYKTGKNSSATFQKQFAEAINESVLATREKTAIAERILAKIYGKSRNSQLATKTNGRPVQDDNAGGYEQPTQTKEFEGERLTKDQIQARLAQQIAAL